MTIRAYPRGWPIVYRDGRWVYEDTGQPADTKRPCRRCGRAPTAKGHDACLGKVEGLVSACCGHGVDPPYTNPLLKCWHCNSTVGMQSNGWVCQNCGQSGPFSNVLASTFEEGCLQNIPYIEQSCPA